MPLSSIIDRGLGNKRPNATTLARLSNLANNRSTLYNTGGDQAGSLARIKPAPLPSTPGVASYNAAADQAGSMGTTARAAITNPVNNPNIAPSPMSAAQQPASKFTTGTANNGTEPMKGWAASMGYTPADIMGMNQMPSRYLSDILDKRGLDPTGGLYYMMEPLADVMMPLFELIYGGGQPGAVPFELNDISNFMGQMFGESMTPGGRLPDSSELMNHLFGGGSKGSTLDATLNLGTPEEMVQNWQKYAQMVAQLSGSPMAQQAMSNLISSQGMKYLNSYIGGNEPSQTFGQQMRNPNF